RAVQFAARFDYILADETFVLCKKMVEEGMLEELARERVYGEWKKLLLKSEKPSQGFELMRELGILEKYFPELYALIAVPQSPLWHPEGDVWIHTMMCVDVMTKLCRSGCPHPDNKQTLKFLFAMLCHDLGKALSTTVDEDGIIRAIGHESSGLEPTKSLMYRLMDEHDFIGTLLPLVEHHLKPSQFYAAQSKASAIRRLATKVNIEELVVVAKADFLGRTTAEALTGVYDAGEWLLEKSKELNVSSKPLEPLLQGRDLIALGFEPSAKFKEILDSVYSLQLDGTIRTKDEALAFTKKTYI
ncbi:MAG: HD domain-containing protein, partial [Sulfurovum sp.]|nr:HD domain-containing protein [Sulfurovum sp.]